MPSSTAAHLTLRQLAERERPFPPQPLVSRYFPAAAIEEPRRRLTRAIDRGDGPGLVIGGAGMGKSLLLQVLAAHFHERFDIVLLGCARVCTRRALLQAILFELGLPYRFRDEGQLRLSLLDHLLSAKQPPTELLLLVDEAQSLSVVQLDELRMLTNLVHGGVPRIRLVIAGSLALEETFASPELESLSQRLAARCYLTAFSREETSQFMRAQLAASRAAVDDVLRPEAWEAVFEATDGVPRLVNQLCDRAISVAVSQNCATIDRRVIQEAWADLQQLPTAWHSSATDSPPPSSNVIEFGQLATDERPTERVAPPATLIDDVADEPVAASSKSSPPRAERPAQPPKILADASNPFSEAFDEEEVVIDGFAAFDLRGRGTQRVENRRDPTFATLVQAALDATACEHDVNQVEAEKFGVVEERPLTPQSPLAEPETDGPDELDELHVTEVPASDLDDEWDESNRNWPPIRLAFPIAQDQEPPAAAVPWREHEAAPQEVANDDDPWLLSDVREGTREDFSSDSQLPIVVVEEDDPTECRGATLAPPRPQVRRQEYRRLFSRLRSG